MESKIILPIFAMACAVEKTAVVLELPGISDSKKRTIFERVAGSHPFLAHVFFNEFVDVWREPKSHPQEFDVLAGLFGAIGRPESHRLRCEAKSDEANASFTLSVSNLDRTFLRPLVTLHAPKKEITLHFGKQVPTAHAWRSPTDNEWNNTWILE